jgi:hypothetical protein
MVENLRELGPMGYVHAAAWCPEQNQWHVHSTKIVPTCPPGTAVINTDAGSACSITIPGLVARSASFRGANSPTLVALAHRARTP